MKRLVNLCFSGGRTSAYMVEEVLYQYHNGMFNSNIDFVITFANTSREHEKTLEFVHNCEQRWYELYNARVIWVEASVIHGFRIPTLHKIVDFKSACRDGGVFEEVVVKYGLPNGNFLHCTRELKENPIISVMKLYGGEVGHVENKELIPANYETWIGIRSDEPRRLGGNKNGKQLKVYPLGGDIVDGIDFSCDKQDVLEFWQNMPFDLDLPEHQGNCVDCHKKSNKKLAMVYKETPDVFNFTAYLDDQYSEVKAQIIDGKLIPRKRFRGYKNTKELIASFDIGDKTPHERNGCETSCEPFMMDNTPSENIKGYK